MTPEERENMNRIRRLTRNINTEKERLAQAIREAVEAEREACAKVAEHCAVPGVASAIRARGK